MIKRILAIGVISAMVIASFQFIATSVAGKENENMVPAYSATNLLVKFNNQASEETKNSVRKAYGLTKKSQFNIGVEVMTLKSKGNITKIVEALNKNPNIEFAQLDYKYQRPVQQYLPMSEDLQTLIGQESIGITSNDEFSDALWGHQVIQAPEAWAVTEANQNLNPVVVAVIDSGIMYNHEDLASSMWQNPGEIPGNGIDDDNNGYPDDIYGWNVLDENGQTFETTLDADGYYEDAHGTHVAGTIAAAGNNGVGIIGVAPGTQIMSLKFFGSNSLSGYTSEAIQAIEYATDNGADIINASWGSYGKDRALELAINAFPGIFVAAAGNDGVNSDRLRHYPSSYAAANIVSVASMDNLDYSTSTLLSYFSNYGTKNVDIAAPGGFSFYPEQNRDVYILSAYPYESESDYKYLYMAGTSMASPHVSGVLALMLSMDNTRSTTQVISDLYDTGVYDSRLTSIKTSAYINAFNAVYTEPVDTNNPPQASNISESLDLSQSPSISISLQASDPDNDPLTYLPIFTNNVDDYVFDGNQTVTLTPSSTGTYSFTYTASDGKATSNTASVTIDVSDSSVVLDYDSSVTNDSVALKVLKKKIIVSDSATVQVTNLTTGQPASGVTVTASWSGYYNQDVTGVTDLNGLITFSLSLNDPDTSTDGRDFESTLTVTGIN